VGLDASYALAPGNASMTMTTSLATDGEVG